jgi:hypothetical protein
MVQQISLQGFPSFAIVVVPVNGSTRYKNKRMLELVRRPPG